jgi:protein-disulfide isomerase
LFSNQGAENSGAYSDNNLMRFGAQAGLNMQQFRECFNSNKFEQQVKDDFEKGRERKVISTPSFFVNGKGPLNSVEVIPEIEKALQGQ